jgi:hypothetical protein
MRGPSFEESPPNISEELKEKFRKALEGKLELPKCRDCVKSQNFVQVIEFLIPMYTEAIERIDRASQTMEEFISVFSQLEERLMKARMLGDDGL